MMMLFKIIGSTYRSTCTSQVFLAASAVLAGVLSASISTPAMAEDLVGELDAQLARPGNADGILINKAVARSLYMEKNQLKSHGIDFMNGCKKTKINKHKALADKTVQVIKYKGITIVGSPYHSAPIKTGRNNNSVYFKRLKSALDIIEIATPATFQRITDTMRQKRGYIIIDNICPSDGGLAFAAFIPRKTLDHFVVMTSSTLLLLPDMFNDYDIAAQLVHEMEGHAVDYYQRGTTDETNGFSAQAMFAQRVGDGKFLDVNNRASNLRTKVKLKLSTNGSYVESK